MLPLMNRKESAPAEGAVPAASYDELRDEVGRLRRKVSLLQETIASLLSRSFGRRTESLPSLYDRSLLTLLPSFPESEPRAEVSPERDAREPETGGRPYRPRKRIPDNLPTVDVFEDVPEDLDRCPNCGSKMKQVRENVVSKLVYEPARIYVERRHIPVLACNACPKGAAVTVPAPPQLIRGGIVATEFVSELIVGKFVMGVPVYRQHAAIARMGCPDLGLSSMYGWIITAYESCRRLVPLLYEELRSGTALHIDETVVQVLREIGKKDVSLSYAWCAVGGGGHRVVAFRYARDRSASVADEIIGPFKGFVQTDGYSGYEHLKESRGIVHVLCLAHIRRKFADIVKSAGKTAGKASVSARVVELISRVYRHEKELRGSHDLSSAEGRASFVAERERLVRPCLDAILDVLRSTDADPSSRLGRAVSYALGCWPGMIRYLECPDLTPDNNAAENAIRPYVVGRKNWLFCGCPAGADASAFFYTLVETAKANSIDPSAYIRFVVKRSLTASTDDDIRAMLPWNCPLAR